MSSYEGGSGPLSEERAYQNVLPVRGQRFAVYSLLSPFQTPGHVYLHGADKDQMQWLPCQADGPLVSSESMGLTAFFMMMRCLNNACPLKFAASQPTQANQYKACEGRRDGVT